MALDAIGVSLATKHSPSHCRLSVQIFRESSVSKSQRKTFPRPLCAQKPPASRHPGSVVGKTTCLTASGMSSSCGHAAARRSTVPEATDEGRGGRGLRGSSRAHVATRKAAVKSRNDMPDWVPHLLQRRTFINGFDTDQEGWLFVRLTVGFSRGGSCSHRPPPAASRG